LRTIHTKNIKLIRFSFLKKEGIYKMSLRSWIPFEKLDIKSLSRNPHPSAIQILEQYPEQIDWNVIFRNPAAIDLIEKYVEKNPKNVPWDDIAYNPGALDLLEKNPHKIFWLNLTANPNPRAIQLIEENWDNIDKKYNIDWDDLSANPNAIPLLEKNPEKINWEKLCTNPNAIHLLEKNLDKIDWFELSTNPNAIYLLEQNQKKIDWGFLSMNKNAVYLFEKNMDRINWYYLVQNTGAMDFLEKHKEKIIDWDALSTNPAIFEEEDYACK
jgi:hypothetical protein